MGDQSNMDGCGVPEALRLECQTITAWNTKENKWVDLGTYFCAERRKYKLE